MAKRVDNCDLQAYLVSRLQRWEPARAGVRARGRGHVALAWGPGPFAFLAGHLLYTLEKNNKLPKWIVVYSGGKTTKTIDNLAPRHPHKFRLRVTVKPESVSSLAHLALQHYGDEQTVCEELELDKDDRDTGKQDDQTKQENDDNVTDNDNPEAEQKAETKVDDVDSKDGDVSDETVKIAPVVMKIKKKINVRDLYDAMKILSGLKQNVGDGGGDCKKVPGVPEAPARIQSQWSEETWTNTDSDGTSATCFGMAVKCGYSKQIQTMLEERPELIGIVDSRTGLTPLATAIRSGDITIVKQVLSAGAEVGQPCLAGQTPLQLAILRGDLRAVQLLLENGADLTARDWNGLRAEHYAADSGSPSVLRYILDRGDIGVRDRAGWTPLFRAMCQGASTAIVEELVRRGSDIEAVDNAGLPLTSAAKLLKNRHGRGRDSILRLVDSNYPHEKALAHFTRLTKKIYHVHTLLKH